MYSERGYAFRFRNILVERGEKERTIHDCDRNKDDRAGDERHQYVRETDTKDLTEEQGIGFGRITGV